jgi:LysR family transcriptional regulator, transcriptional activator of nhaA
MNFKHLRYFWVVAKAGGIARASEQLHITQQTLSGQIKLLEQHFGKKLFGKRGRRLELTDTGRWVLGYADEIFALGNELEGALSDRDGRSQLVEFRVGVADSVPKAIACRLLQPALKIAEPVRLVCQEGKLQELLSRLALHRLDLIIADSTIPGSVSIKAFNHRLGESGLSFFASSSLTGRAKQRFPRCLDNLPVLMPGTDSAVRLPLEQWFQSQAVRPRIVGEFDDGALMKAFGRAGFGVFAAPSVLEAEIEAEYKVKTLGRTNAVKESFFAISVERRITHPCVTALTTAARDELFG